MTIYVDDMQLPAKVGRLNAVWSHLLSDVPGEPGTAELVEFASRLGLKPSWIQHPGTPLEHFDVTEPKRHQAIRLGARQIRYGTEGARLTQAKYSGERFVPDPLVDDQLALWA